MAKARATCTCATCGKTFEVTAYKSNSREARKFEEWAEANITECRDCEQKRLAEKYAAENAMAAKAAADKDWPELTGSEKQIAWANTIREAGMTELLRKLGLAKKHTDYTGEMDRISDIAVREMINNTKASWWIDNRNYIDSAFRALCRRIKENPEQFVITTAEENRLKDDDTTVAEPDERKHEGIVEITVTEERVFAAYRKDDDFRTLVKNLEYHWDDISSKWIMKIGLRTGTAQERAAELGNKLLNAGFAIRIQDADTLRDAIEGNYQPMTHRWIARREDDFYITWSFNHSFYDVARRIPGAKYSKPGMLVPSREYEAVLDFAYAYGFRLTPGAQKLAEEMKNSSLKVNPSPARNAEYEEHPVSDILNSSTEIIDDLKD